MSMFDELANTTKNNRNSKTLLTYIANMTGEFLTLCVIQLSAMRQNISWPFTLRVSFIQG